MARNEKPAAGGPSPGRKAQAALGNKLNRKAKEPPTVPGKTVPKKAPPARRSTGQ
jgi:hypothetical protein